MPKAKSEKQTAPAEKQSESKPTKKATPQQALTKRAQSEIQERIYTEQTGVMNPIEFKQTELIVRKLMSSQAIPTSYANEAQVFMAVSAGRELGLKPVQSVQAFYIVNGSMKLWGKYVPFMVNKAGWRISYEDESKDSTTVVLTNATTGEVIRDTFYFKDAVDSGYTKDKNGGLKFGWREGVNRKKKLRYGAINQAVDTHIPYIFTDYGIQGIVEVEEDFNQDMVAEHQKEQAQKVQARVTAVANDGEDVIEEITPRVVKPLGEAVDG